MANEIEFEIVARLDKVEKALQGLEKTAEKTGDKITESIINARMIEGLAKRAFGALKDSILGSIKAAEEQEVALNRMNNALAMAGRYSAEASADFQNFASGIQNTTTLSDDAAMSYLALASNFAKTNDEAKKLTQAAIDLSAATGKGVEESIRGLGVSLTGTSGKLGQIVPQLKGFTEEQLKAGAAVDYIAQRFKGAAANEINTFSGAVKQLTNMWDELGEATGNMIIKSPSLVAAIKFISQWLGEMVKKFTEASEKGGDALRPFLTTAIDIAKFFTATLGPVVELVVDIFRRLGERIGAVASAFVNLINGDFKAAAMDMASAAETMLPSAETLQFKGTEAAQGFLNGVGTAIETAGPVVVEQARANAAQITEAYNGISFQGFKNAFALTVTQMNQMATNLMNTLKTTFVTGLSSAFAGVGAALVKGGNVFAAFGKGVLSMFGDLAMQLGQFYFTLGLASWWVNPAAGTGEMAAGAALMVLGGALKALAGGGGGAAAPAASGSASGGQTAPVGQSTSSLQPQQERQVGTAVEVNIAGSVLGDKRTLGREIADALNEAFGTDGITLARGAVV